MRTWLPIVVVIVAFLVIAMLRERWRLTGIERMGRERGFRLLSPFIPGERPPVATLVRYFDVRGGRVWGIGVEGVIDGVEVTIAEHETRPPGSKSGVWQTIIVWPVKGSSGPFVLWPKGQGDLVVSGDEAATAAWLTKSRRRALEAWPHGGELAIDHGYGAWRVKGLLTPGRLDELLRQLPAARRALE